MPAASMEQPVVDERERAVGMERHGAHGNLLRP